MDRLTWKNIFSYLQGWFRYFLYYSKLRFNIDLSWLLLTHIRQQIDVRINSMDEECYLSGSCKICGCATTALQMANKPCEADCYPKMLSRQEWKCIFKNKNILMVENELWKLDYTKHDFKQIFVKI